MALLIGKSPPQSNIDCTFITSKQKVNSDDQFLKTIISVTKKRKKSNWLGDIVEIQTPHCL